MNLSKRILFVIPTLCTGGISSSLTGIINLHDSQNTFIRVIAIAHEENSPMLFKNKLLPKNKLWSAYYCKYSNIHKNWNLFLIVIKTLKRISLALGINMEKYICKKGIKDIEKKYKFDCVIAFQEGDATKFVSYLNYSTKIAWIHCDYNKYLPKDKSEKSLYSQYQKIVCVSDYTANVFRNRYPDLAQKTISIHNSIDQERIKKMSLKTITDNRFTHNIFTIISLGRIAPVKRFYLIPQIANQLLEKGCSFKWYILGPNSVPEEMEHLTNNIKKYGVNKTVIWLGNKNNPYPYFAHSDLLVTLSSSEACPMIFNEAKITQLPVVSSDFGSSKEFINNGIDGIISPVKKMSEAIFQMTGNTKKYQLIKKNISNFNCDNSAIKNKLIKLLQGI